MPLTRRRGSIAYNNREVDAIRMQGVPKAYPKRGMNQLGADTALALPPIHFHRSRNRGSAHYPITI